VCVCVFVLCVFFVCCVFVCVCCAFVCVFVFAYCVCVLVCVCVCAVCAAKLEGYVYPDAGFDPRPENVGFVVDKLPFHQLTILIHSSITEAMRR
jgi:hypothetical protein